MKKRVVLYIPSYKECKEGRIKKTLAGTVTEEGKSCRRGGTVKKKIPNEQYHVN
jgi:hypothetical protein